MSKKLYQKGVSDIYHDCWWNLLNKGPIHERKHLCDRDLHTDQAENILDSSLVFLRQYSQAELLWRESPSQDRVAKPQLMKKKNLKIT